MAINMTQIPEKRNSFYNLVKDGKAYVLPSVTSIIGDTTPKPQLIYWAARLAARAALQDPTIGEDDAVSAVTIAKSDGGKRGSLIHSFIEAAENKTEVEIGGLPEFVRGYALAHQKFVLDLQPKLLYNEQTVANFTFGYAGTLDRVYEIAGKTIIVDFKTTAEFYKEMGLQLVAYKFCEFMYSRDGEYTPMPKIDQTMIVLLGEDGTYQIKETDAPFEVFMHLKEVWLWMFGNAKMEKVKTKSKGGED